MTFKFRYVTPSTQESLIIFSTMPPISIVAVHLRRIVLVVDNWLTMVMCHPVTDPSPETYLCHSVTVYHIFIFLTTTGQFKTLSTGKAEKKKSRHFKGKIP